MKWLDKYILQTKIFFRYLVSIVGIVLLAVSCIVMIAVQNMLDKKYEQEIEVLDSKLGSVAEDINGQINDMRRLVMKLVYSEEFKEYYRYDNPYYKIDLLEQMDKYKDNVDIMEDYFLIYSGKEEILSNKYKTLSKNFCGKEPFVIYGKVFNLLEGGYSYSKDKIYIQKEKEMNLLLFPLEAYGQIGIESSGIIGFILSDDSIDAWISSRIGKVDGELVIYYDEFGLYGTDFVMERALVVAESSNGKVQVCAKMGKVGYLQDILSYKSIALFWGSVLLALLLSVFLAYKSTMPIYRLTKMIGIDMEKPIVFNWKNIEMELERILQNREHYNEEIYRSLRQQIIWLITAGRYRAQYSNVLLFFNIRTGAPLYGVISCTFPHMCQKTEYYANMIDQIETLTSDAVSVYACWESELILKILIAAEESAQFDEMMELLDSFFESVQLDVTIELFEQGTSIEALKGVRMQELARDMKSELKSDETKMSKLVNHALQYMKEHCIDNDMSLEYVAEKFSITPTYLSRILKKETGITYREYITNMKMERAKELLLEENANVMQVSETIGYVNVSYFIKLFKNYTGLTPAKYREENYERIL